MSPTESEYRKIQYGCQATILKVTIARENSPVTQTTPEPTLLSWGGGVDHAKKFPSPLATHIVGNHRQENSAKNPRERKKEKNSQYLRKKEPATQQDHR